MILEVAILNVKPGEDTAFEASMTKAKEIISKMPGFCGLEVSKSLDVNNQYLLHVKWARQSDHTEGFRKSAEYQEWRALLHHYYDPMPIVEYYGAPIITA